MSAGHRVNLFAILLVDAGPRAPQLAINVQSTEVR